MLVIRRVPTRYPKLPVYSCCLWVVWPVKANGIAGEVLWVTTGSEDCELPWSLLSSVSPPPFLPLLTRWLWWPCFLLWHRRRGKAFSWVQQAQCWPSETVELACYCLADRYSHLWWKKIIPYLWALNDNNSSCNCYCLLSPGETLQSCLQTLNHSALSGILLEPRFAIT